MSDWKEYRLGDIADITSSKRIFYSDYVASGIPFYRSKEIIEKAKKENVSTELFISNERYNDIKNKFGVPYDGDILIAAVGERAGISYYVRNDGDFYFKDGNLIWFRNFKNNISSEFLVYYFNSYVGQQILESTMIGSAQKALTIIGLKGIEVNFPTLPEQYSIVSILRSLDDKIDLLQRQNKTLEQLAETLFRQWFIEEAENNWETEILGNIFDIGIGRTPPRKEQH
jgi:type I restriction enzyme S subunit